MVSLEEVIYETPNGVRVLLQAHPGAAENRFPDGIDEWRGRIHIRVTAPAEDDAANRAIVESVANFFDAPSANVIMEKGPRAPRKSVLLKGVDYETVMSKLVAAGL